MDKNLKVAVTGANGFIGNALCKQMDANDLQYVGLVRPGRNLKIKTTTGEKVEVENLFDSENLSQLISGCTTMVHLAGRVHQPNDNNESHYIKDNIELTEKFIQACSIAKIDHFIFISTSMVYGEQKNTPFEVTSHCYPISPYGKSKLHAEQKAQALCRELNIKLDIIRIPLVIDSQAKGNLNLVAKLLKIRFPLPLSGIRNQRSYVKVDTLINFIIALCSVNNSLAKERMQPAWLHAVCEVQPLSTLGLLQEFSKMSGFRIRSFFVPQQLLRGILRFIDLFRNPPPWQTLESKLMGNAALIPGSLKIETPPQKK